MREPRPDAVAVPTDPLTPAANAAVERAGVALNEARDRYYAIRDELNESEATIRDAQAADEVAVRKAVAEGKDMPRPKAQAAIERAAQLVRALEQARILAVDAENDYLNAWRSHREAWLDAYEPTREKLVAEAEAARDAYRDILVALRNGDQARSEIEKLGDPSKVKHPDRANVTAFLKLRGLDPDAFRRRFDRSLEQQRSILKMRPGSPVERDLAALLAALTLEVEGP